MDIEPELHLLEEQIKVLDKHQDRLFSFFIQQTQMGYGRIMQLAQRHWRESLIKQGMPPGGEFQYGPCVAMTVPCGCERQSKCDWCCGSGWLTEKVKAVKDQMENSQS